MTDQFSEPTFPPGPSFEPPSRTATAPEPHRPRLRRRVRWIGPLLPYRSRDTSHCHGCASLRWSGSDRLPDCVDRDSGGRGWRAGSADAGSKSTSDGSRDRYVTAGGGWVALDARDRPGFSRRDVLAVGGHRGRGCHRRNIAALTAQNSARQLPGEVDGTLDVLAPSPRGPNVLAVCARAIPWPVLGLRPICDPLSWHSMGRRQPRWHSTWSVCTFQRRSCLSKGRSAFSAWALGRYRRHAPAGTINGSSTKPIGDMHERDCGGSRCVTGIAQRAGVGR
jgi:hypothetical protein